MSSIALIDRRCVGDIHASMVAKRATHTQIIDTDEQGLSVLCGLLSAYPAVETLNIMVHGMHDSEFCLGHDIVDVENIRSHFLPPCDEMTLVIHGPETMNTAEIDMLCQYFRTNIGAIILNGRHPDATMTNHPHHDQAARPPDF